MFIRNHLETKVMGVFRRLPGPLVLLSFFLLLSPNTDSQKLQLSFSYFNLTRNNGGGTTEPGDTLEIHALAEVNSTTKSFYFIDTIPTGLQYVSNSLELMTNEGVLFPGSGPYTDASNDDLGVYYSAIPAVRVNIGTGASNAKSG
ncbi:MAG: hypothetical protein KGM98_15825, partial [Bacteroidota bacterium]|nr:hypothetical protein [Bacteroidota bacterium]